MNTRLDPTRNTNRESSRNGFTLVELMIVVVIMGIISVTVIPAMGTVQGMREGAARDDLVRLIEVAKGKAVASGRPYGLWVDLADSSITIVQINDLGETQNEFDPLTNGIRTINLSTQYSGVTITSMINGDGAGGSGTIWFDYEANPHTRDLSGSFSALNSSTVRVSLSSGALVIIYPHSGTVEVQ